MMMIMMMNLCLRAVSVCALDDDGDDSSQKWWLLFEAKMRQIKVGKVSEKNLNQKDSILF